MCKFHILCFLYRIILTTNIGVYVEATLIRHGSLCNIALNFIDFSSLTFYNKVTQQYLMPRFFIFWNFLSVVKFRYSLNVFVKLMNIAHSYFNMRTFLEWFLCYNQVFLFPAGPLFSARTLWERRVAELVCISLL